MRELKLRYFIDLVSNIGARAKAEAQTLEQAQKVMQGAITGTNNRMTDWTTLNAKATRSAGDLRGAITGATDKFTALDRVISRVGSNTSTERQVGYMRRLEQSIGAAESRATRLRQALANGLDKAPEAAAAVAGGYYAGKRVVTPFVGAFSDLESATTDLKISMMDASGQVSKDFEKISKEAVALGNQLPGTTKDFMLAARGLQVQSVPSSVIANGGLRASSYVGALLNLNQEQASETIAKLREAHGLKEDELVPAADLVQRGYFGFGIKPGDYLETAKYAADTYNVMGIKGIDQMRETLAIQGMAANVGLEGSSFGTNYAQMLRRLGQTDTRLNKKSAEAKEAKALLDEHGIKMEFFDDKGVFKGNLNMLQELSKIRSLNPLDQQHVTNRIFGVEASRPAQVLISKGLEGYNAARETIDNQANLDQRIESKMQTFASKLEALGGTITNVQAQIATQLGERTKPMMDKLGSALGGPVQGFFKENPTLGTTGLLGAAGVSTWLGARVGGGLLKSFLLRGAPAAGAVAGGAVEASASGGAATAAAAASGTSRLAMFARGLGGLNPLMMLEMLSGPSESDIEKLYAMDRRKAGFRGNGFDDPRRLDRAASVAPTPWSSLAGPPLDLLTLTAPGAAPAGIKAGQQTELKVGEGRLALDVRVTDERVSVVPFVTQQPSLIRIDTGSTDPGGFRR